MTAGVRAFPPLVAAIGIVIGLALTYAYPVPIVDPPATRTLMGVGAVLIAAFLALAVSANLTFRKAGTPANPYAETKALTTAGPYGLTRNPMYLGLVLVTAGLGLVLNSMWLVLIAVPVLLLLRNLVILHEERYLEEKFGDTYRDYTKRVRRWL
jgi:protein-S-isoprenylcysteine O-methyltransferase Ste14